MRYEREIFDWGTSARDPTSLCIELSISKLIKLRGTERNFISSMLREISWHLLCMNNSATGHYLRWRDEHRPGSRRGWQRDSQLSSKRKTGAESYLETGAGSYSHQEFDLLFKFVQSLLQSLPPEPTPTTDPLYISGVFTRHQSSALHNAGYLDIRKNPE